MTSRNLKDFLDFCHQAEGLKRLLRHSWLSDGRQESVAEHSWRLCLMVMVLGSSLKVDIGKAIKMALIHDLAEVYAGDSWAFKGAQKNKHQLEEVGLAKIVVKLPLGVKKEIMRLWQEYEMCQSEEAKLVKALDKLEVLIQHNESSVKTWDDREYAFNFFYGNEYCEENPLLKDLRKLVKEETRRKIKKEAPKKYEELKKNPPKGF